MHQTLFDYMTGSGGLQYLMALAFIAGFLVLWEVLMSARPFKAILSSVAEDLRFTRGLGGAGLVSIARKCAVGAALFALYLAALPFVVAQAVGASALRGVSSGVSFGWSPVRAYFTGRRKRDSRKKENAK